MFGFARTTVVTFVLVARPFSTSTMGVLFTAASSGRLTWEASWETSIGSDCMGLIHTEQLRRMHRRTLVLVVTKGGYHQRLAQVSVLVSGVVS